MYHPLAHSLILDIPEDLMLYFQANDNTTPGAVLIACHDTLSTPSS